MARIRTIKPEFWTDEKVVALTPLARLLFIGMWNFVDDEGRAEYSPARMKMQILPADSADIAELLGEIRREKLINVYSVEGKEYFAVIGFSKHQKVDKRTDSKHPAPPTFPELPRIVPTEGKGKEGIKEGKGKEEEERASAPADDLVFSGEVISLKAGQLARWRKQFHAVQDIMAELHLADIYYTHNPPKDGKWFFAVSQWLKRAHDAEIEKLNREKQAEISAYRGAQFMGESVEEWQRRQADEELRAMKRLELTEGLH